MKSTLRKKIDKWCTEIKQLSKFAKTQPRAAYAAFIHSEVHRFSYFLRTIPSMGDLLQPLDEAIENHFLPTIISDNNITKPERNLYSLPIRLGGLGIPILTDTAEQEFSTSVQITAPPSSNHDSARNQSTRPRGSQENIT